MRRPCTPRDGTPVCLACSTLLLVEERRCNTSPDNVLAGFCLSRISPPRPGGFDQMSRLHWGMTANRDKTDLETGSR